MGSERGGTKPGPAGDPSARRDLLRKATELPRTGAGVDRFVAAGLTAAASDAAFVPRRADMKSRSAAPQPADAEPET
jgi:hypothetical protein